MIRVVAEREIFAGVEEHLATPEQVGFFVAEFDGDEGAQTFRLRGWRPIQSDGYAVQTDFHVALNDEVRVAVIQWAWQEGLSLVEVHSHAWGEAEFSLSDLRGFDDWVSHMWWRLQGRPYAALVTGADDTFDGLAWIKSATSPRQIEQLTVGQENRRATGATLAGIAGSGDGLEGARKLRRRSSRGSR